VTAPPIAVTDPADPMVADYVGLSDAQRRIRRESPGGDLVGIFIAEGENVVRRATAAGFRMRSLLLDAKRVPALSELATAGALVIAAPHRGQY
jgi:hypothetical protein